mgnify:CR=1 FL=1
MLIKFAYDRFDQSNFCRFLRRCKITSGILIGKNDIQGFYFIFCDMRVLKIVD